MLTPFNKMRGFTLIELMVAVAIFGLLLALGSRSFASWIQNQQIRTGAESILNGMQLARGEAVKRNASAIFVLCDVAAGNTGSSWDVLAQSTPSPTTVAQAVWLIAALVIRGGSGCSSVRDKRVRVMQWLLPPARQPLMRLLLTGLDVSPFLQLCRPQPIQSSSLLLRWMWATWYWGLVKLLPSRARVVCALRWAQEVICACAILRRIWL